MIMDQAARELVSDLISAASPLAQTATTRADREAADDAPAAVSTTYGMRRATTALLITARAALADAEAPAATVTAAR